MRVLERLSFAPARHHQPHVNIRVHFIGGQRRLQRRSHLGSRHPDIEIDVARRLEQPVKMLV